ncbi:MAG: cytochrome c [Chloroflexi bacterium]|nr:cytochrome c [Chloroflexota bacterium]
MTNWPLLGGIIGALVLLVIVVVAIADRPSTAENINSGKNDPAQLVIGQQVYTQQCAVCHGANLEGEATWQEPNPDGSFRAPPHNDTGHTWHHGDSYLFERTKYGTAALSPDMQRLSNMPAYEAILSDAEIMAVLAYIQNSWSGENQQIQANITANE